MFELLLTALGAVILLPMLGLFVVGDNVGGVLGEEDEEEEEQDEKEEWDEDEEQDEAKDEEDKEEED